MIYVKLLVFFVYIACGACRDKYCKICLNHTLCKYPQPGPAINCKHYSVSALLSNKDISDILSRINERRNFVALGQSRRLPQAANMRKIVWSEELAMFAQRWADQCDSHLRPDREDQCRDLHDTAVGQNIATVLGPSPGLEVKSLIDLWYMQSLDYNGSVTYYNRSKDSKTNYFNQLIWAASDTVGCGRARFFEDHENRLVERLVCNFAPRGNIHGKPVYAIGYPATQCPEDQKTDEHYKGLCSRIPEIQNKSNNPTKEFPPASSVLRILMSTNSAKQEIDPIKNNLKYIKFDENKTDHQRNQRIRHVITNMMNNSYAGNKAFDHQPQMHVYNNAASNFRRMGFRHHQQEERGHSRVYHDHEHKKNDILPFKSSSEPDFRRYEFATESTVAYPQNDLRKHNPFLSQCTRRVPLPLPRLAAPLPLPPPPTAIQPIPPPMPPPMPPPLPPPMLPPLPPPLLPPVGGYCPPNPCCYSRCPQGPPPPPLPSPYANLPPPPCAYPPPPPPLPIPLPPPAPPLPLPPPIEPCSYSPPCIPNAYCPTGCQCLYDNISPHVYPNIARSQDDITIDETRKSGGFHYYDLFPNLSVRSGDSAKKTALNKKLSKKLPITAFNKVMKSVSISQGLKENEENSRQVNDARSFSKYEYYYDYPYMAFDVTDRKKRETEDGNTRPFWQMDEFNFKHLPELKAMRYTTLSNALRYTEPITISLRSSRHEGHITEKFLSFDELMHLRKFNDDDNYNALRKKKGKDQKAQNKKTTKSGKKTKSSSEKKLKNTAKKATTTKQKTTTNKKTQKTTTQKPTTQKTTTQKTTKSQSNQKEEEAAATIPQDFTTNTPFVRKKHCTRVKTCTWTIITMTGQDGSIYHKGGGGIGGGSRTPPGYVEGCTRTSTCTRIFLNRNKVTEPSHDGRGSGGGDGSGADGGEDGEGGFNGDEDYCERRSLDVKKKSGDKVDEYELSVRKHKSYNPAPLGVSTHYTLSSTTVDSPLTTLTGYGHDLSYPISEVNVQFMPIESTTTENHNCLCYQDNARKKRDILSILQNRYLSKKSNEYVISCENDKIQKYPLSYGDLYYMVLNKIMKTSNRYKDKDHSKTCHCASGSRNKAINKNNNNDWLLLFLFITFYYFGIVH